MIKPYSAPLLPGAHENPSQHGKHKSSREDFAGWLDLNKPKVASTAPEPARKDFPGRNFPESVGTHELPHAPDIPRPGEATPRGSLAQPPVAQIDNLFDRATVSAAGERVDFVAVLWHLTANAGLSYRSVEAQALQALGGQVLNPSTISGSASGRSESAIRAAHPMIDGGERQAIATHRLEVEAALREARREDATTGVLNSATLRAGWAPLLTWPQRVLRWLGDIEGTTAWVRDYQIDLTKLESLIDSLRCLAEQQGIRLHRIMLNGHELWRAPSAN